MRAAEMYLIQAEAECRLEHDGIARDLLKEMVANSDGDGSLAARIDTKSGNTLNITSSDPGSSLLDEIILQRRIELWGEGFRVHDIVRLKTGFSREYTDSNHSVKFGITDPESWEWIMLIPQKEFDGNINMDAENDQNP